MRFSQLAFAALTAVTALAAPGPKPASNNYKGYLFIHFPLEDEAIYGSLSKGSNALAYNALANNTAILRSTVGTKGLRDHYLLRAHDNTKFWIISTDLNAHAVNENFDLVSRNGSRSFVVFESKDLINWSSSRLTPPLVDESAGNVWAPEATWDPSRNAYMVYWATRFFDQKTDPGHNAQPIPGNKLMYSHTTDFKTFTPAKQWILNVDYPVIDVHVNKYPAAGPNAYVRFVKHEDPVFKVYQEISTTGLLGKWTHVKGGDYIEAFSAYENNEGPFAFESISEPGQWYLYMDENTEQSYLPAKANTLTDMSAWNLSDRSQFPKNVKHGSVLALTGAEYDRVAKHYGV